MKPPKIDPIEAAMQQITHGLTGEFLRVYVDGSLPDEWRVCDRARVHRDLREPASAAVYVVAESPRAIGSIGARVAVRLDQPINLMEIGAEITLQLRRKIENLAPRDMVVKFSLEPGAIQPTRGTECASGYDLHALADAYIPPGQVMVIDTGVRIEMPSTGMEGQVRPRSGMTKRGLWVALGTIDADYRGTIGATVANLSRDTQQVKQGDRVAQLVIARVEHVPWVLVPASELTPTERGERGWGSTGR